MQMGLRAKILSGFLILSMMLIIAGLWSVREISSIGSSVQRLLDDNYKSIDAANKMSEALERQESAVLLLHLGKAKQARENIASADSLFERGFQRTRKNKAVDGQQACVDSIAETFARYKSLRSALLSGGANADLDSDFSRSRQALMRTKKAVDSLLLLNEETLYRTATGLQDRARRAIMPGIVAILSALVFTFIFIYFVNYYAVNPIVRIKHGIEHFTDNNVPFENDIESRDEIFDLACAIKTLCERVHTAESRE